MPEISKISKKKIGLNSDILIPTYIFKIRDHTILESLVVFLKERKSLSFRKIAVLINRDLRHTYNTYKNAKKKLLITNFNPSKKSIFVPLSIFSNKKLSPFEALVLFLKDSHSLKEISLLLNRDQRTIWTVNNRAHKKNE